MNFYNVKYFPGYKMERKEHFCSKIAYNLLSKRNIWTIHYKI